MKIIGIVSTFYPNIDELVKNIQTYLYGLDKLIIWENTPAEKSQSALLKELLDSTKVEIHTIGKNEYLAAPFNRCIAEAKTLGYDFVLTMDQDSGFDENGFSLLMVLAEKCFNSGDVAVVGSNSMENKVLKDFLEERNAVIMSGSIIRIDTFLKLGGFKEDLLIDAIDTEYCMRAKKNGYKTLYAHQVSLEHSLGYRHKHWTGVTLVPYSAQRTYYYIRNSLWMWKHYPSEFEYINQRNFVKYKIIYRTLKMIFEPDTLRKIHAMLTALWHARIGKLGTYDHFIVKK